MNKVVITGVAGMIGSHLLDKLLSMDIEVIGIDNLSFGVKKNIEHNLNNPLFHFIDKDINELNAEDLSEDVDVIVHLAAYKKISDSDSVSEIFRTNGIGTENILKIALQTKSKVVIASTSDVYGDSEAIPFSEEGNVTIGPSNIKRWSYAASKLYGEHLAFAYHHDHGLPVVVLRYFGGFSPRSKASWSGGHVPIFINAILNDKEIIVHGDGSQTRSMGYVEDLVDGTILAMEKEAAVGEIINIGNDEEMSVIETAHLIYELADLGKEKKIVHVPIKQVFGNYKEIKRRIPDLQKARTLLNYEPKYSLRLGLQKTIQEYKA